MIEVTRGFIFAAVVSLASSVCAFAQSVSPPPTGWQSALSQDHPLVGKIIATEQLGNGADARIDYGRFIKNLAHAQVVLLGEVHDNPDHHVLQGWALVQIALSREQSSAGLPVGAAVFEYFRADQQMQLDAFTSSHAHVQYPSNTLVAEFKRAVDWDKSGWPDIYDPLFQNVFRAHRALYAGDAPRALIKRAAKEGRGALSAEDILRLKLDAELGYDADNAMAKEIAESHCGMLPASAVPNMSFAQRYRDAHLADAVLAAIKTSGAATLFAGNGHIRNDRAVPWYLRRRAPNLKVLSVAFVEVEDGKTDVAGYVPRDQSRQPAVDFIYFTPRPQRSDPCEGMTEMMGKPPQKAPAGSPSQQP